MAGIGKRARHRSDSHRKLNRTHSKAVEGWAQGIALMPQEVNEENIQRCRMGQLALLQGRRLSPGLQQLRADLQRKLSP